MLNTPVLNQLFPYQPGILTITPRDEEERKLFARGSVNNSSLTDIRRRLMGEPGFTGLEPYLITGSELHKRSLTPWLDWTLMDDQTEEQLFAMWGALNDELRFVRHLEGATVEQLVVDVVLGQLMHGTLDIEKGGHGGDIKTTSTKSYQEFIYSMVKYGYFRQAVVYKLLKKLKKFTFYAVQKYHPYNVYIIDTDKYPAEMKEAERELKFLIYFFQKYGIPTEIQPYRLAA